MCSRSKLGQLAADRHPGPLAAFALASDHDALGKTDILDPRLNQLGGPQAGFEQGLERRFSLADHMKATGAQLDNGMLQAAA